ncbi:MAG: hypothetical protein KatS3mg062_0050 [Tepidiforma sp.]|nr:MAG: hypothetical protein KatS3mg062_0050 [Tepidiforma sp.]
MIGAAAVGLALLADALALACAGSIAGAAFPEGSPSAGLPAILVLLAAGFAGPRLVGAAVDPRRGSVYLTGVAFALILTAVSLEATGSLSGWTFRWLLDFYRDPEATMETGAPAVVTVLLLAGAWARGAQRAEQDFDLELHPRTLVVPFAVVIVSVLLGAGSSEAGALATLASGYFAAAVASLALSQLALGGATLGSLRAGGLAGGLVAGTAGAALAIFVVFGILAPWLGPVVLPPVGRALEAVLIVLLTPLAWLLTELFERLLHGVDPFAGLERVVERQGQPREPGQGDTSVAEQVGLFGLRTLALVAFTSVLLGILLVWTRARRRYITLREAVARSRTEGSLREDLLALLGRRPRDRGVGYRNVNDEVVRLYLDVLHDAGRRGRRRAPAQTPHEFAPVLHDTFASPLTDDITRMFEEARYAGRTPDPERVREAASSWARVRRG